MVRTVGEDAPEQKVIDDIAKYGWHCVNILAEGDSGPFSFTVGLFQSYGHPEFIVFGLPSEVAHQVLNIAVEAIQAGRPIDLSQPTDDLLEGYPCCFVKVPVAYYHEHLGFARWYYQGDAFPTYQIVFPSRDGHFPWHPEATESFRSVQPVLGHPQQGAQLASILRSASMKLVASGLTIELQTRRPVDDEDQVRVQVLVKANGFRGDFEAWLQLGDLERFALELGDMHEHVGKPTTATLASAEPDIHIKLTMQSLGAISGTYALESERPTGTPTLLSGAFEIDQSYLPGLRQSVEALIAELAATAR